MTIVLTGAHKGGDHTLAHDLNFQHEKYEATHVVVCRISNLESSRLQAESC